MSHSLFFHSGIPVMHLLYLLKLSHLSLCLFVSGCVVWLVESQFPDQGLNLGLGTESPES